MLKELEMELLKRFSNDYRKASKKRKGEIFYLIFISFMNNL
jgi:hypothetical protein